MRMTWGIKVQRVTCALVVVGALALASGLDYIDLSFLSAFVNWLW